MGAGAFGESDDDDIRAGPDGGEVAAEDGAQYQGPPQHVVSWRAPCMDGANSATIGVIVAA